MKLSAILNYWWRILEERSMPWKQRCKVQNTVAGVTTPRGLPSYALHCPLWKKGGSINKVTTTQFFSSRVWTSFCWAATVNVCINTFLIRHVQSDARPIHLHPCVCLGCDGNKCVGGINTRICLKLAGEQFVPNGNVFAGKKKQLSQSGLNTPVMWRGVACFYLRIE